MLEKCLLPYFIIRSTGNFGLRLYYFTQGKLLLCNIAVTETSYLNQTADGVFLCDGRGAHEPILLVEGERKELEDAYAKESLQKRVADAHVKASPPKRVAADDAGVSSNVNKLFRLLAG